jgi:hypothetical protein
MMYGTMRTAEKNPLQWRFVRTINQAKSDPSIMAMAVIPTAIAKLCTVGL